MNKHERDTIVKNGLECKNTLEAYKTILVRELSDILNALNELGFRVYSDEIGEPFFLENFYEEDEKIYFSVENS